jgi:hypothetical protein
METSLDEMYNVCMFVAKYVFSEGFVFFLESIFNGLYVCMYVCMYACMPRWLLACL